MELYKKSAAELSVLLEKREVSAEEVCGDILSRIEAVEPFVGAYITVDAEGAVRDAKNADARRAKGGTHPLTGVPISLKDNICVKSLPATAASKMLEGFVSPYSATVAELCEQAGMVLLGKNNLDEFAMGASCAKTPMQSTRNPHDVKRIAGGSSGGSAAAVAAGEGPLSLGTDTGGSVRGPASYCGTVGVKPTFGAVSRNGVVAFGSSLDQVGVLTRNVTDAAMLLDLLCRYDRRDAISQTPPYEGKLTASLTGGIKGLRIGLAKEFFADGMMKGVRDTVTAAANKLASAGAEMTDVEIPSLEYCLPVYYIISSAEGSSNMAKFDGLRYGHQTEGGGNWQERFSRTRAEALGEEVKRRIMIGTYVLTAEHYEEYFTKARLVREKITRDFASVFEKCDLLLSPSTPNIAPCVDEQTSDPTEAYLRDICTVSVNLAGLPALSLPCGFSDGMPVGLQLIGPRWSEPMLLNAAYAYEQNAGLPDLLAKIGGVE